MNRSLLTIFSLVFLIFSTNIEAQKRRQFSKPKTKFTATAAQKPADKANLAIVVDERLAVLRSEPSLFAQTVQRMRRGRQVSITGSRESDGVTFYRVVALPNNSGWVQAEAVVGRFRRGDDARLARLVQASEGFEQIERAQIFLETFNDSALRPA